MREQGISERTPSPFDAASLSAEFTKLYSTRRGFSAQRQLAIEKFARNQISHLRELQSRIEKHSYKPDYRGLLIEQQKPSGPPKVRGITPLRPDDWVVQRILLRELENICGSAFATSVSYGRSAIGNELARSPANCCQQIAMDRRTARFAFRADLVDFFPSVNRSQLVDALREALPIDWEWFWLVEEMIRTDSTPAHKATAHQVDKFWPRGVGVHQGTVLAPFLANVVMASWDRRWCESTKLFRYVDDWLVLGESESEIRSLAVQMADSLPDGVTCHLDNPKKCDLVHADKDIDFLGLCITSDFRVTPNEAAFKKHALALSERASNAHSVVDLIVKLTRFHEAWKAYYRPAGLSQSHRSKVDERLKQVVDGWISEKTPFKSGPKVGQLRKLLLEHSPPQLRDVATATVEQINFAISCGEVRGQDATEALSAMMHK